MTVQLQLGTAQTTLDGMGRVFAGRDPQACQLAFMDPTLSRRHAEIYVENGQTFIRDLGSANGTWVDGQQLGHQPVPLRAGSQVWLGHVQLGCEFAIDGSKTAMATSIPPELKALIEARKMQQAQQLGASQPMPVVASPAPQPPQALGQPQAMAMGGASGPLPTEFAYRKQGSNDNGVLLLALRQDTFFNGNEIEGFVEFTATDTETVASIFVELVELVRGGPIEGHVWDRFIVRQGPWRAKNGDVLPLPFKLRVPPGTTMTGPDVYWQIRGEVDINWASDISAKIDISMRNQDMDRIRDGLGAMDYRLDNMTSVAKGQRFEADFHPPANLAKQWGVNDVRLELEYLGANLKIRMKIDKKGLKRDPQVDHVIEIARMRKASQPEINATLKQMLDTLMSG
ncbi:MAG: FHA domain-containing protein [Kofleriaceae bacterium]